MRRLLVLLSLLVAVFATAAAEKEPMNILFIGNSFTFRHNLPQLVKTVFEEGQPRLTVNVHMAIYGGQDMFRHWTYYNSQTFLEQSTITPETIRERIEQMQGYLALTEAPPEYVHYWEVILPNRKAWPFPRIQDNIKRAIQRHEALLQNNPRTKWDYVVLQSWQDVRPDLDEGYAKYAMSFANVAKQQGAEVILYITAPNIQNAAPVEGPQLQERVDLEIKLARAFADKIGTRFVVPVPLAINMIQQGGTNLTFCYKNDFHPNQTTAFLTANMFYAAVFKKSSEGFSFDTVTDTKATGENKDKDPDGGPLTVVFAGDTKAYLQKMAFEAVQAFDSK